MASLAALVRWSVGKERLLCEPMTPKGLKFLPVSGELFFSTDLSFETDCSC